MLSRLGQGNAATAIDFRHRQLTNKPTQLPETSSNKPHMPETSSNKPLTNKQQTNRQLQIVQ
jgi:hypothetical protein